MFNDLKDDFTVASSWNAMKTFSVVLMYVIFLHVCNMISNGIIKIKKCIMKNKKHGWET